MGGTRVDEHATVRVLGSVAIEGPQGASAVRGRQPATIAVFLALAKRPVTRDQLAELLWGEQLSPHWQSALRGVVSKVRSSFVGAGLAPTVVRSDDTLVHLDLPGLRTDLELIEELVELDEPLDSQLAAAKRTLAVPFLPHDDSDWGRHMRDRIHRTAQRVTRRHALVLRETGRLEQAVSELRAAAVLDPLDEASQHLLIETLAAAGRRTEASEALDTLTNHLALELGVTPAQATTDLLRAAPRPPSPPRPAPEPPPTRTDVRATLHPHSDEPFVGRRRELDTLRRCWTEVVETGRPRLVIIEGPAGMGKTRLADQFLVERAGDVGQLMWGRNRDARDRSFGALDETVQRLVDGRPDLVDELGDRGRGLWPLLPRFRGSNSDRDDPSIREMMVDSLRALLETLQRGPILWFVDDLQWASSDQINVVESVVDGLQVPVLVIATTRNVPSDIAASLGSLQRVLPTTPMKLRALSIDEVGELLTDRASADSLQTRTGGLPFFVSEIARQARLTDHEIDVSTIPDTITDWVMRRVQSLPPERADLLRLASVIGHEVDLHLLAHCSSIDTADVASSVDALAASGLLTFDRAESLQFSHAITRDVIHDGIGSAARMQLHRHVGDAIAELEQSDDVLNHALLAHHYRRAGPGAVALAWKHSMLAARRSMRAGAWASAADHYAQAAHCASNSRRKIQAMVGAGRARVAEGELGIARNLLVDAVDLAEEHDFPTLRAAATLSLVGRAGRGAVIGASHDEQARLLRAALGALERVPQEPSPRTLELWSDLERELAVALLLSGSADERNRLLHRSLERARSIEPARPRAVARGLLGVRYAKLDPSLLASRIGDTREVLAMSVRDVGSEVRLSAFCYLHEDLLRRGDWDGAEQALARAERLAERYPHSYWTWAIHTWRALWLLRIGDTDSAERSALAASAMRPGIAEAEACMAVNLTNIRLHQGRAGEMMPFLSAAVDAHPEIPTYRAVYALCAAESGDDGLAADVLTFFADQDFTTLPDDPNRFLGLAVLAHVAAGVGDRRAIEQLLGLLQPYRDQWVVLQCYGGGGAEWGPAAHALARMTSVVGSPDEARRLYQAARQMAADVPPALARIERDQAQSRP